MLETLRKILSWDLPSPEILLEEDGCLCLDWLENSGTWVSVSIHPNGGVSWAGINPQRHGSDLKELQNYLESVL